MTAPPHKKPIFSAGQKDLSRLCIHTITTKPWDIHTAIGKYAEAGVGGISVWRQYLEGESPASIGTKIKNAGLTACALVRGGFYTGNGTQREASITENKKAIDECAAIEAEMVVLVCGATPGFSIAENIRQIEMGIEDTLPHAENNKIKLAIEPLHPMYADTRSAISTLKTANDLCEKINSPYLGVAADVFHIWWDPDVRVEIERSGRADGLFGFHICDWKMEMADMLNDRGLMGEGIINIAELREQMDASGFKGFHEVEVFSDLWWTRDQDEFLKEIIKTYEKNS